MKRPVLFITLAIASALGSCDSKGQNVFPDTVTVSGTADLKRVKGTRFFVKVPATYQPLENLVRYQKNGHTYLQVVEIPNSDFSVFKARMSREAIESQGAKVDEHETVRYNGFEGLYFEGPSKTGGETKLGLAFGDESFVTMVIGVCRTGDHESKEELKKILGTSAYDKAYPLSPLELANFRLDEGITGFRYAATMGNIFFYSPHGKADMQGLLDFSSYQVMPLDAGSFEKIKELMVSVHSGLAAQGVQVSNIRKQEILINGHQAYEVTMDATDNQGRKGTLYQVGIFKESTSSGLLFSGADADKGAYLDKFRATARSIRL